MWKIINQRHNILDYGSKSAHLGDELISILFIEASRLRWVFLHILQPALRRKRRLLSIIQLTKRPITHPYFGFIFALTVTIIFFTLYIGWHNRLIIKISIYIQQNSYSTTNYIALFICLSELCNKYLLKKDIECCSKWKLFSNFVS